MEKNAALSPPAEKCTCKLGKNCCSLRVDFILERKALRIKDPAQEVWIELAAFPKLSEFIIKAKKQDKLSLRRDIERHIHRIENFTIQDMSIIDHEERILIFSELLKDPIVVTFLRPCARAFILFTLAQFIRETDSPLVKAFTSLNK